MNLYYAKTPEEYREIFYTRSGLYRVSKGEKDFWENRQNGFVYGCGRMDRIYSSVGSYTIPSDFLMEYQYAAKYLHFGIIYEELACPAETGRMEERAVPSVFLVLEKISGGVSCFRRGQRFRGAEAYIELHYMKSVLLPFLGASGEELSFLKENIRYSYLSEEMRNLIVRMEQLLQAGKMTEALMTAICMEFIALLLQPDCRDAFCSRERSFSKYVQVGKRRIRMTQEDFRKVAAARDRIEQNAASFFTIYELSRELEISEQKLKAGFKELYRQTIWDYANSVRMNRAVMLLQDTELGISEIARRVGYQSQAAFIHMFKKWCGVTPGQFRAQAQSFGKL